MNSSFHGSNVSTGAQGVSDSYRASVVKNTIVLALGLIINYINSVLIHSIRKHQIFYAKPHYILFTHLVFNDMLQLSGSITLFVASYIFHKINASLCLILLTLTVFTTLNTPLNLAFMAVECYVAVCLPMRHARLCSARRIYAVIGLIWAMSSCSILPDVFIMLATEHLQLFHSTIYCEKYTLFRHPVHKKLRDVSYILYLVCVWLVLLYTYLKIFMAARDAKAARSAVGEANKARNTILLHSFQLLLCMLTYVGHLLISALVSWFPKIFIHLRFVCYIFIQILPRSISPAVYGLRDKTLRQHVIKHLLCTNSRQKPSEGSQ